MPRERIPPGFKPTARFTNFDQGFFFGGGEISSHVFLMYLVHSRKLLAARTALHEGSPWKNSGEH